MHKNDKLVDMHIHTCASDGSHTPQEIISIAQEKGISIISVTDHECLDSIKETAIFAKDADIMIIKGVELSSSYNGKGYDILGYCFDTNNIEFHQFVKENRKRMDDININLLNKMSKDYDIINIDNYNNFEYDRKYGGWKCLHYLASIGLEKDFRKCTRFYSEYGIWKTNNWFPCVNEIIKTIKRAGGFAILAHPGVTFKRNDIDDFNSNIKDFIDMGIDGIECLYPIHDKQYNMNCIDFCKNNNLIITAGSDNHGNFSGNSMGGYPLKDINIKPILQMMNL